MALIRARTSVKGKNGVKDSLDLQSHDLSGNHILDCNIPVDVFGPGEKLSGKWYFRLALDVHPLCSP